LQGEKRVNLGKLFDLNLVGQERAMTFTTEYKPETDCIVVRVEGELDLALLQRIAAEVSKIVERVGCKRILNDMRNAKPTKLTMDIYEMPGTAKQAGVHEACKRALVVTDETPDFHFLETVFRNQGHQVRMFTNLDDAKAWLFDE